ncbi:MAG: hypothetical protein OXF02_04170 [Simkaniaceae bacterium]|nr:hypothetical protein [Simkaniaceae bacterium]
MFYTFIIFDMHSRIRVDPIGRNGRFRTVSDEAIDPRLQEWRTRREEFFPKQPGKIGGVNEMRSKKNLTPDVLPNLLKQYY